MNAHIYIYIYIYIYALIQAMDIGFSCDGKGEAEVVTYTSCSKNTLDLPHGYFGSFEPTLDASLSSDRLLAAVNTPKYRKNAGGVQIDAAKILHQRQVFHKFKLCRAWTI